MSLFYPIFKLLNDNDIRYIVVGGVATVMHGYIRATTDLDLVIDLTDEQVSKTIRVLVDAGYKPRAPVEPEQFADVKIRQRWIKEKNLTVFSLYHPDNPVLSVDLFAQSPIPFDELWKNTIMMPVGDLNVRTCAIADLIEMKQAASRPIDIDDADNLAKIMKSQSGNNENE